jgi:hypothetical protein
MLRGAPDGDDGEASQRAADTTEAAMDQRRGRKGTGRSRIGLFVVGLALSAAGLLGCGDDDEGVTTSSTSGPTTTTTAGATPTSSTRTAPPALDPESPVGHFVTEITAADGRDDLVGVWGFNIEADGTWSICPFCTDVPGPYGGTYTLDGDRLVLGADRTCEATATYRWSTEGGVLALTALDDDPCGLVPGNRRFVLTTHPLTPVEP